MSDKPYLVDDEPFSARELIQLACKLDKEFAKDWLKRTSVAASILRENGYTVTDREAV